MAETKENISVHLTTSTIVHNYRFFYYLANENAHLAIKEFNKSEPNLNEYRYSVASVIFAFATVEGYFNHILHSTMSPLSSILEPASKELRNSLDRLPLLEKIEYAILNYNDSAIGQLHRGEEPFQSFELLRRLRNFLIHYTPKEETVGSTREEFELEISALEKQVRGKFEFNSRLPNPPFVYRCFSADCAKWTIEVCEKTLLWLSDCFDLECPVLERHWKL